MTAPHGPDMLLDPDSNHRCLARLPRQGTAVAVVAALLATALVTGPAPRLASVWRTEPRVRVPAAVGLAPAKTKRQAAIDGAAHKRHKQVTAKKQPQVVLVPAPVVASLLLSVSSTERQMASLTAYADAEWYLKQARSRSAAAAGKALGALGAWGAAKSAEHEAVLIEAAAQRTVELYESALDELGLAEYTGQTAETGTDPLAMAHEVEVVQFGQVAANDTAAGLARAQQALARSQRHVRAERRRVADAWGVAQQARLSFVTAQVQVETSHLALLQARRWATVGGQAPTDPIGALARLEGNLVPRSRVRAVVPTTTTTAIGFLPPATTTTTWQAVSLAACASDVTAPAASGTQAPGAASSTGATAVATSTPATTATTTATTAGTTNGAARAHALQAGGCTNSSLLADGPTVLGGPLLSAEQVTGWFRSTGAVPQVKLPISKLVADYMTAGQLTGVRADIAFAQSVVETGYFSFPPDGQDPAKYNNFAGIGACGSCKHGFRFSSPMDGVMAQEELLNEYASGSSTLGVAGCCQTWMALSGVWATNPNYGFAILSVYLEMLSWALKSELGTVGLVAPASPAAPYDLAAPITQPAKSELAPSRTPPT